MGEVHFHQKGPMMYNSTEISGSGDSHGAICAKGISVEGTQQANVVHEWDITALLQKIKNNE